MNFYLSLLNTPSRPQGVTPSGHRGRKSRSLRRVSVRNNSGYRANFFIGEGKFVSSTPFTIFLVTKPLKVQSTSKEPGVGLDLYVSHQVLILSDEKGSSQVRGVTNVL